MCGASGWCALGRRAKMAETKKKKGKTTGAGGVPSAKAGSSPTLETGEVVKFDEAGMPTLDVWLEDETIWLTQKQMGLLFGCAMENVIHHLKNIYAEEELAEAATTKEFLVVRMEGRRSVARKVKHYNLDAVISVGYRVNSKRGTRFRQWATSVLKEYLLRGLVRDQRIGKLEKRMTAAERSIGVIIDTLMPALPENREPIGFHT